MILGVCNAVGSSIPRTTHAGVYTHAGPEIGVASTKAFTAQLTVLSMMAIKIAEKKGNKANADLVAKLPSYQASFQEYKTKAFEIYKKTLALDTDNYDSNFNMSVMYFNEAVETKRMVDAMDMKTYQASGKDIEMKACSQFNTAKPYFDKCKSLKPDDDLVIENLKNLDRILGQCKN